MRTLSDSAGIILATRNTVCYNGRALGRNQKIDMLPFCLIYLIRGFLGILLHGCESNVGFLGVRRYRARSCFSIERVDFALNLKGLTIGKGLHVLLEII